MTNQNNATKFKEWVAEKPNTAKTDKQLIELFHQHNAGLTNPETEIIRNVLIGSGVYDVVVGGSPTNPDTVGFYIDPIHKDDKIGDIEKQTLLACIELNVNFQNIYKRISIGLSFGEALRSEITYSESDLILTVKSNESYDKLLISISEALEANAVNEDGSEYVEIGGEGIDLEVWKERYNKGYITKKGLKLIEVLCTLNKDINLSFNKKPELYDLTLVRDVELAKDTIHRTKMTYLISLAHFNTIIREFQLGTPDGPNYKRVSDMATTILKEVHELREKEDKDYFFNYDNCKVQLVDEGEKASVHNLCPTVDYLRSKYVHSFVAAVCEYIKGLPTNPLSGGMDKFK